MNSEQEIDAAVREISGGRVLDVATGPGSMIDWMVQDLKDYREMIGIDATPPNKPSDGSLFDRENIRFIQMDAHHLDFEDASFDTVTIGNSLHHMANPRQVLAEMDRVLKPSGHLIIREMYRDNQTEEQLTHVYLHHFWAAVDTALGITHNETFTRQQLVDFAESLGLRRVACYDFADFNADPHAADTINLLHDRLNHYLNRAKDLPNFPAIQARGEELSRRLDAVGMRGPTALIVIGEK